eukprot:jgi/Botrbrau1/13086/Bobra.0187s0046.1
MAASDRGSAASTAGGGPGDRQSLERLIREVEALRVRMAEASAEAAGEASNPGKVLEALDASDARLQALMAETHLLQSGSPGDPGSGEPASARLRESFARVLHDNAELRQRLNGVVRQRIASLTGKGSGPRGPAPLHPAPHGLSPGSLHGEWFRAPVRCRGTGSLRRARGSHWRGQQAVHKAAIEFWGLSAGGCRWEQSRGPMGYPGISRWGEQSPSAP